MLGTEFTFIVMGEKEQFGGLEERLFHLFKSSFILNCELDDAAVTAEELKTLEELDALEVLDNLEELLKDLLNVKEQFSRSDAAELAARAEQFEAMLQKLEGEVRGHIRVEHQLKLHVDNTQGKLEEVEALHAKAQQTIKQLEEQLSSTAGSTPVNAVELAQRAEALERKDRVIAQLEKENTGLKLQLKERLAELELLKKQPNKSRHDPVSTLDMVKKRISDKSEELNKLQARLTQKVVDAKHPIKITRDKLRGSRKLTEADLLRGSPYVLKKTNEDLRVSGRTTRSTSRQHMRSYSDQRSHYAKRAPSR